MRAVLTALVLGGAVIAAMPVQAGEVTDEIKAGKRVYMTKTCLACHGRNGAKPVLSYPALAGQNEAYLYDQLVLIKAGKREGNPDPVTGHPFIKGMTDIMHLLEKEDLKNVSAYLASLPPAKPKAIEPAPSEDELAAGAKAYKKLKCRACHGKEGERASSKKYPIIAGLQRDYLIRQMTELRDKVRTSGKAKLMFPTIKRAKDEDIVAIATWLSQIDRSEE